MVLKLQRNVRKCCVADVRMCCVADVRKCSVGDVRICCVADVRKCCVADVLYVWLHLLVLVCRCQPQSSVYCESSVSSQCIVVTIVMLNCAQELQSCCG